MSRDDDVSLWINKTLGTFFSEEDMEISIHPNFGTAFSCGMTVPRGLAGPIPMVLTQQRRIAGVHNSAILTESRPPLS